MDKAENERQCNVVDQMLSMHALLRDSYARRAFWLKTGLIATSISLCAFVFAADAVFSALGLRPEGARIGVGLASVAVLILSIVELRVNWDAAAARHAEAAEKLAALKAKYRKLYSETQGNDPKMNARLGREYERTMQDITPTPDRKFNSLKAKHLFKKRLSQRISESPETPVWLHWLQLRWHGIRRSGFRGSPGGGAVPEEDGEPVSMRR
jgi:hypothetical protein